MSGFLENPDSESVSYNYETVPLKCEMAPQWGVLATLGITALNSNFVWIDFNLKI